MNSGRRGAFGRLDVDLSTIHRGPQIGIGYYESVGSDYFLEKIEPAPNPDRTPQVVTAPKEGDALLLPQQRAAKSALQMLGIFAAGVAAVWVGKEAVGYLRGDT